MTATPTNNTDELTVEEPVHLTIPGGAIGETVVHPNWLFSEMKQTFDYFHDRIEALEAKIKLIEHQFDREPTLPM